MPQKNPASEAIPRSLAESGYEYCSDSADRYKRCSSCADVARLVVVSACVPRH